MFFINIFLISLLFIVLLDIYINNLPKSELFLLPIKYKIKKKESVNEVVIDLKIINKSNDKETMVPNLNLKFDFFKNKGNQYLTNINYEEKIYIQEGSEEKNINNYWPTTIIKSNSELFIKIILKFKNKDLRNKVKYVWLKVLWENYGHFGLTKKKDCFLVNLDHQKQIKTEVIKQPLESDYEALSIRTDLLGSFDNPVDTTVEYCKGIVRSNDILTIGESPLAIMQNRYISPENLKYNLFSKMLCYFFHPTSSLATACGMQLLINKIGLTRITISLTIGLLFKLIGIKGIFYRLTGAESSLIDDISGTITPYDKSIVMGPHDAKSFCDKVSKILNINVAVVDVNDLGKVKILASSNPSLNKILKKTLKGNPAGNGDEKTPIVLIRNKM